MYAIHSVFILKENIAFMEEWIDYHLNVGLDRFFLYDNSKVQRSGGCHPNHKCFIAGKVNKYNVDYDGMVKMTDNEMDEWVKALVDKYPMVDIVEWSPKGKDGVVLFDQEGAHNHCLARMKSAGVSWCANIDMDEFVVVRSIHDYVESLDPAVSIVCMSQVRFDSRFNNIGTPIVNTQRSEVETIRTDHSNKNLYRVKDTNTLSVHGWIGKGSVHRPELSEMCFNHYKMNLGPDTPHRVVDNIDPHLRARVVDNRKTYIPTKIVPPTSVETAHPQ